jgi:hypothetical protein
MALGILPLFLYIRHIVYSLDQRAADCVELRINISIRETDGSAQAYPSPISVVIERDER